MATGNSPGGWPFDTTGLNEERLIQGFFELQKISKIQEQDRVLILGTALTMVDYAIDLLENKKCQSVRVLSRKGLLPREHFDNLESANRAKSFLTSRETFQPQLFLAEKMSPLKILRQIRQHVEMGCDPRILIDSFRPFSQQIWQSWNTRQRKSFFRHLKSYWESFRHRMPSAMRLQMQGFISDRRLSVQKGKVQAVQMQNGKFQVFITGSELPMQFDWLINCTGSRLGASANTLHQQLTEQNLVQPDSLEISFELDDLGRSLRDENLFFLGPQLKARYWECTAVPELRIQAKKLATFLFQAKLPNNP
jgi:uncharacterized NAD(P)/FAD-binding protein YdhS